MCGLYGFSNYGNRISKQKLDKLINALAKESTVRGTHATGIAYNNHKGKIVINKEPKAAVYMDLKLPKNVTAVIGHCRHATQGDAKDNYNNHPFRGVQKDGKSFALAHNGVLYNDRALRKEHNLPDTKIETDSFIAVQLLEKSGRINAKSLASMAEKVAGTFNFTVLDNTNTIYLVKGDNPLSMLHLKTQGVYVYASTEEILWKALVSAGFTDVLKKGEFEEISIEEGQILAIDNKGNNEYATFEYDYYSYSPKRWKLTSYSTAYEDTYKEDLKEISVYLGYSPDFVERLLHQKFTLEEIEEFLYGEMDMANMYSR